ncbi:MAG: type A2 lanthipeptide [Coriobacteriales bacterium]|nr:type A2 lanthipeptide [Coriobacteriales bacterium]
MQIEDLSPEMLEEMAACQTTEEIVKLAMKSGQELTDEELDQIAGGFWYARVNKDCPNCHSTDKHYVHTGTADMAFVCNRCGTEWYWY